MSFFTHQHQEKSPEAKLSGRRVALLATNGFEKSELFEPRDALERAGAEVRVVSLKGGEIKAWEDGEWGDSVSVDDTIEYAEAADFDALLIPGGVVNPDTLRNDERVVGFVTEFMRHGKPVAAICHGPQVLIETGLLKGRRLTSWPSLRTDLMNAGAIWLDDEVITDQGLVTSRKPRDLPAFNRKMVEVFSASRDRRLHLN